MNFTNIEWKAILQLVWENVVQSLGTIIFWEVIGLIASIVLIRIYSKKKILQRSENKYYHWAVKLYIPYLLILGLMMFGKMGIIRSAHKILTEQNQAAVDVFYTQTFGKVLGSADDEHSLIRNAEKIGQTVKSVDEGLDNLVYYVTFNSDSNGTWLEKTVAAQMAGYYWRKQGKEIIYGSVYYLVMMGAERAHLPEDVKDHMTYENFKLAIEKLKELDASELESGIKEKIGSTTQGFIDSKMNGLLYMTILLWLLLALVPLIEYLIYVKVVKTKLTKTAENNLIKQDPPSSLT